MSKKEVNEMNPTGKNGSGKAKDPFAVMAALAEGSDIYTTAEIMLATGLPRGTITSRAKLLRYERNGIGYTADQVYRIVTYTLELHRKNEKKATKLRNRLNEMLEENGVPFGIAADEKGKVGIRQMARDGPEQAEPEEPTKGCK